MKVLITGGAGFLGSHLAAFYRRNGAEVLILDNSDDVSNLQELGCDLNLIKGDASDPSTFNQFVGEKLDLLFHLGGSANVPMSVKEPVYDFKSNVTSTVYALEFARQNGVAKVVFPSTSSVYAPGATLPVMEDSPVSPSSPYGAGKLASEGYCLAYARTYGLNTTVLRFFNVYGPLMRRWVIHDLVKKLQKDPTRLEIMGDGNQLREYLYVDDAVNALALAAKKGGAGEVYNVGTGDPVTIRELALEIIEIMGFKDVQLYFTMESWPGDIRQWYADISKFSRLGFKPAVGRREGVERTVKFMLSNRSYGNI